MPWPETAASPRAYGRRGRALASGLALAAATLALVAALAGCSSGSASSSPATAPRPVTGDSGFDGAALPPGAPHEFTLTDQYGRRVSLRDFRGQVAVLTFLSPTCGRLCVLIAQQIRGALDELGGKPVPVLIVSANPAANDPARVRRFLATVSLTGRALYLSGSPASLRRVWRAYGLTAHGDAVQLESSATVILLDRSGRERVLYGVEQLTPEALAHDIGRLQAG
jgi:protein SCO1